MKYLSDYALGAEFIVTPQIAEKLKLQPNKYLNARCRVYQIRIETNESLVDIILSTDKHTYGYTVSESKTLEYTIDDYYKNQNLIHTISTCANVYDVIIDEYSRRFFEIYRISLINKDHQQYILYHAHSSNPDDNTIIFSEDKLKFFIDNKIYRHVKWGMSDTASDTPVENK